MLRERRRTISIPSPLLGSWPIAALLRGELMGALACLSVDVDPAVLVLVPLRDPGRRRLRWAAVVLLLRSILLAAVALRLLVVRTRVGEFSDHVVEERHLDKRK